MTIHYCTFANNGATEGGGMANRGALLLTDSTLTDNGCARG